MFKFPSLKKDLSGGILFKKIRPPAPWPKKNLPRENWSIRFMEQQSWHQKKTHLHSFHRETPWSNRPHILITEVFSVTPSSSSTSSHDLTFPNLFNCYCYGLGSRLRRPSPSHIPSWHWASHAKLCKGVNPSDFEGMRGLKWMGSFVLAALFHKVFLNLVQSFTYFNTTLHSCFSLEFPWCSPQKLREPISFLLLRSKRGPARLYKAWTRSSPRACSARTQLIGNFISKLAGLNLFHLCATVAIWTH